MNGVPEMNENYKMGDRNDKFLGIITFLFYSRGMCCCGEELS